MSLIVSNFCFHKIRRKKKEREKEREEEEEEREEEEEERRREETFFTVIWIHRCPMSKELIGGNARVKIFIAMTVG